MGDGGIYVRTRVRAGVTCHPHAAPRETAGIVRGVPGPGGFAVRFSVPLVCGRAPAHAPARRCRAAVRWESRGSARCTGSVGWGTPPPHSPRAAVRAGRTERASRPGRRGKPAGPAPHPLRNGWAESGPRPSGTAAEARWKARFHPSCRCRPKPPYGPSPSPPTALRAPVRPGCGAAVRTVRRGVVRGREERPAVPPRAGRFRRSER